MAADEDGSAGARAPLSGSALANELERNRSGKFNDVSGGGNYDEFVMERE